MTIATRESAKHLGFDIKGASVAIQGFGNVGSVSAQLLSDIGAKIVAVTDWKGGVYSAQGLDVSKLIDYVHQAGAQAIVRGLRATAPNGLAPPTCGAGASRSASR